MKYTKKDLAAYNLHIIETDKFKTITVRVVFHSPIIKEEITLRNVLCDMFLQSSKNYDSKRKLTIEAQNLYAATLDATNSRLGNYIVTNFNLSVLNDKYTEEGNFARSLQFLSEVIFNPDVENEKFKREKLDIVKTLAANNINSVKEDATSYSLMRMADAYDKSSPVSFRMLGYLEDLEKINEENLYDYYLKMLEKDFVDIFVVGSIKEEEIVPLFKENFKFKTVKRKKVPYLIDSTVRKRRLFAKETIDNSQSKIAICNVMSNLTPYERFYPLTLYNIILGGGSDSKLFKNVREENSLCYSVSSITNKLDNLLIIMAGIDKASYKKCLELIEENMLDMKKGKFTEKDLKIAKEYYISAIDEMLESESSIIDNYLMVELIGVDDYEEKRKKMLEVTKRDIIRVAKKIKMDTVFFLEGVKDEGN